MVGSGREAVCYRGIKYSPLESQRRFHASEARFKGFSGPIGSGKSQALCQEAVKLSYINAGRTGLLGAPTYPMLRDATLVTLTEILDGNRLPYELLKAEGVLRMKDTNSKILLRSVDEFDRLRGTNLAWFGLDELTYSAEAAWLTLQGRVRDAKAKRLCGFAVWTPRGFDWVYERFIASPSPEFETVLAKPFENRHLLAGIPDFYDRLKGSYDETLYQQEALGSYLNLHAGRVYTAFERSRNLVAGQMDAALPLLWTLDFNVDPMCSLVAQERRGTYYVLDEIALRHATTQEACAEFARRFPDTPAGISVYGDASGHARKSTGDSDYRAIETFFRESGRRVDCRREWRKNPPVRERIAAVNAKLCAASGEVNLWIDPRCKGLVKDLEQVSYKPNSVEIDKDRDFSRTHLSDALGYLVCREGSGARFGEKSDPFRLS